MADLRPSSNGAKSTVTVLLLCLCLASDAFPIVSLVSNSEPTSKKVVDPPQAKKDRLLPLLLKLGPKPSIENEQQEIGLKRMVRSTGDEYILTTPGSGDDDSYVYSTTAEPSSENDTYVYSTTL